MIRCIRINIKAVLWLFFIIVSLGCDSDEKKQCFSKAGDMSYTAQYLEKFEWISLFGVYDVVLEQDSFYRIEIEAPENLLPLIDFEKRGRNLHIEDHINCQWSRKYHPVNMCITFKDIVHIRMMEPCNIISVDTLYFDEIEIWARGDIGEMDIKLVSNYFYFRTSHTTSGLYTFSGKTNFAKYIIHGSSGLYCQSLTAKEVYAQSNSISDMYTCATEKLSVSINEQGDIYYFGDPEEIISVTTGSGKLIHPPPGKGPH